MMHRGDHASELWASLALRHSEGLGPRTWKGLLDAFGSAARACAEAERWPELGLATRSLTENFLQEKWRPAALEEWRQCTAGTTRCLLYSDASYPERLRQIPAPPLILYALGRTGLLDKPCVAMVGARSCSRDGLEAAGAIAAELSRQGIAVVSGFALGIDRQSHAAALQGPGSTIAVLGTGIDLVYPARNRDLWQRMSQNGLLLTEFSPGTKPEAHNFPRRNRIISGLCLGVLVVEAARQSGSLITARAAMEQNREVFALPGPISRATAAGCNALIREGAQLVRSARDIIDELEPLIRAEWPGLLDAGGQCRQAAGEPRQPQRLSQEEQRVVHFLLKNPEAHIDTLARALGWESGKASHALLMLEMRGVVKQGAGMYYSLAAAPE